MCLLNASHRISKEEMASHILTCPDRKVRIVVGCLYCTARFPYKLQTPQNPPKLPRKSLLLAQISPFVFPNLTKTLGWVGGKTKFGKISQKNFLGGVCVVICPPFPDPHPPFGESPHFSAFIFLKPSLRQYRSSSYQAGQCMGKKKTWSVCLYLLSLSRVQI